MKRVLVVGANGPTGKFVAKALLKSRYAVTGTYRNQLPTDSDLNAIEWVPFDCGSTASPQLKGGFDALVSCVHLEFAPALLSWMKEISVPTGVFFSSTRILSSVPDPVIPKLMSCEKAIQESGINFTILRPTMIYGHDGDRNLYPMLQSLKNKSWMFLPDGGKKLMQPMHVEDVAAAVVQALIYQETKGRTLALAGPNPIQLSEVIKQLASLHTKAIRIIPVPLGGVEFLVQYAPKKLLPPNVNRESVARLRENVVVDISPAREQLGYSPRPFAEGIECYRPLLTK
jgi:nucleoside-diphosphate-sugar epimerase